jgi:hypothetical protein
LAAVSFNGFPAPVSTSTLRRLAGLHQVNRICPAKTASLDQKTARLGA